MAEDDGWWFYDLFPKSRRFLFKCIWMSNESASVMVAQLMAKDGYWWVKMIIVSAWWTGLNDGYMSDGQGWLVIANRRPMKPNFTGTNSTINDWWCPSKYRFMLVKISSQFELSMGMNWGHHGLCFGCKVGISTWAGALGGPHPNQRIPRFFDSRRHSCRHTAGEPQQCPS